MQDMMSMEGVSHPADLPGRTERKLDEVHHLHVWDWDALHTEDKIVGMIGTIDPSGAHFETRHRRKDGTIIDVELSNNGAVYRGSKLIFCICRDITARKQAEAERLALIEKLQAALAEIKTLRGILPICAHCKKIRDDKGIRKQIEVYVRKHSHANFGHPLCPDCVETYFPGCGAVGTDPQTTDDRPQADEGPTGRSLEADGQERRTGQTPDTAGSTTT